MAKIVTSFDTVSKELEVSIDGSAVANVVGVEMYPSWDDPDEFRCCVVTSSKDESNDIRSVTQLCASETPRAKELVRSRAGIESKLFPGFVEFVAPRVSKASRDIAAFFGME